MNWPRERLNELSHSICNLGAVMIENIKNVRSNHMSYLSKLILVGAILVSGFNGTLQAETVEVRDSAFTQTVSTGIVVVDFYASWCGPCKKFGPVFEKLSNEMEGSVVFVKCNADDCVNTMNSYKVQSIPTVILFKDGVEVARNTGFMDQNAFRAFILNHM
jgi:thioredoxin 1